MNIYELLQESKCVLNQSMQLNVEGMEVIPESLELELYDDMLVVVSNEVDRKKASQETFRNKGALYSAGFRWNSGISAWTIDKSEFDRAKMAIIKINSSAKNELANKANELLEKIKSAAELRSHSPALSRKEELGMMIEKFIDDLSTSIDEVKASEIFKKYLEFGIKFRSYSWYNTMLIWMQKSDATKVAGFKQWQDKFHRRVKTGAKRITILAPMISKRRDDPEDNKSTGLTPTDPDSDQKEKELKYIRFIAVTVFDISDTEPIDERGKVPEAPNWKGSNDPNEKADEVYECAAELADNMGIKLETNVAKGLEQGWSKGDHINITSDIAGVNRAATIIHEIAHELLHFKNTSPFFVGDIDEKVLTTETAELQAESVSYIVIRYYGLPAEHHATYLALWRGNKDAISKNIMHIRKAADFIINEIDKIQEYRKKHSSAEV